MRVLMIGLLIASLSGQMVVRTYVPDLRPLKSVLGKANLDIASGRKGEYYDLVVNPIQYELLRSSGLRTKILVKDLIKEKEKYRQGYHSYSEVVQILRNLASSHPNICRLDSLGKSYEGRWIYCLKVSDNPNIEDPTEPDILFDALHHAREWATIEVILFYADTLTSGYNSDPVITDLINNNEIWLVPIVNVDGYVYDYPSQMWWRKNREPFGGSIGTDPNRNYNGVCGPDKVDAWGHIPNGGVVTHRPSSPVFCGAYGLSADCDDGLAGLIRSHNFNAHITYHSYAEEILWPWAHKTPHNTPDAALYQQLANTMSSLIQRLSGGNYYPSQVMYPVSGSTDGWAYGYNHYIGGEKCISYTIEVGTSFYQPVSDLPKICRENWEGALFLARMADSIRNNVTSEVPPPTIAPMDTIGTSNYYVYWSPKADEYNHPDYWQLDELKDYSFKTDDLESGTDLWTLNGFQISTARYHSASHSLYSGRANNISNYAQTRYRYYVKPGDQLRFWCWYDLESNYDVAVAEVSPNNREWYQLGDRLTGSSGGWVQKSYSLSNWLDQWIYIRFRCMTDDNTLREGFYVDDITLVPEFGSVTTISSSIPDTFYQITNQVNGHYYYRVRGHNNRGWGRFSQIEDCEVLLGVAEEKSLVQFSYSIQNSPSKEPILTLTIPNGDLVQIMVSDVLGRRLRDAKIVKSGSYKLSDLPSGVYFLEIRHNEEVKREKIVILRGS